MIPTVGDGPIWFDGQALKPTRVYARVFECKKAAFKVLHESTGHICRDDGSALCGKWKYQDTSSRKNLLRKTIPWSEVNCKKCLRGLKALLKKVD